MLFRESFITDAGVELLSRADSGAGAIIWTRAATSSEPTDDWADADMNAMEEADFGTKTSSGAVTNAIVNDTGNGVAIFAELTNEEYSGLACTFGAWAKIEGDENDVLAIVARCGGATPTAINPADEGRVKAFVDFTLEISTEQAQAIEVLETNYYASQAALESEQDAREALAARAVTTHVAGDEATGEAQTILGIKTFEDRLIVSGIYPKASAADKKLGSNGSQMFTEAWVRDLYAANVSAFTLAGKIEIAPNVPNMSIGDQSNHLPALYVDSINVYDVIYADSISAGSGDITSLACNTGTFTEAIVKKFKGDSTQGYAHVGCSLIPDTTRAYSLGSESKEFDHIHASQCTLSNDLSAAYATVQTLEATVGIDGLVRSLYEDGVGGLAHLVVGLNSYGVNLMIGRGELVYDGMTKDGKTISVVAVHTGTAAVGKYRLIDAVAWTQIDADPQTPLAIRVE